MLDLCDPALQVRYGITLQELQGGHPADVVTCRRVMRLAVHRDGYRAIRAPSAAAEGEVNLMIYPASAAGRLLLANAGQRVAMNYGPAALRG